LFSGDVNPFPFGWVGGLSSIALALSLSRGSNVARACWSSSRVAPVEEVAVDTVITVKGFFDWALGERLPLA